MNRWWVLSAWIALGLLGACGGGGGSAPPPASSPAPAPAPIVLSGSIAVAETAMVDSDTNDIAQTGRSGNNSVGAAQPITSPVLLVGTVNVAGQGPVGATSRAGDVDDYFSVQLTAGQVIELEFSADPGENDLDLYVFNPAQPEVPIGYSDASNTRSECIRITASGSYVVLVNAYLGASIYNMRIGAPGTAGSCANSTTSARFEANELLAQTQEVGHGEATSLQRLARIDAQSSSAGPQLLRLSSDSPQRLRSLAPMVGVVGPHKTLPTSATESDTVVPSGLRTLQSAKALRKSGLYAYVHPNWIMQRHALTGSFPPNDRHYLYQRWHYEQIGLPEAMARIDALPNKATLLLRRPIVAVIDDGVMRDHPDFVGQLLPGCRFVASEGAAQCGLQRINNGDNNATVNDEPVFHGTHVAGTVGAATAFPGATDVAADGGAGVAPMAQILPLRVFPSSSGGARNSDIIQAMRYAAGLVEVSGARVARRADVINLSLGADIGCEATDAFAVAIADVRAAGTLVVASAGNSGRNGLGQRVDVGAPANCLGAIAVGATDARRSLAEYTNTGSALTVAAPGGDLGRSTTGNGAPDGIYSAVGTFNGSTRVASFGAMMGTSMAAPHVAGVLALMRFVDPDLSPARVDQLFGGGALTDDLGTVGFDNDFGHGLINARKAVDAALIEAENPAPPPPVLVVASPSSIDLGSFQTEASFDLQAAGTSSETVTAVVIEDNPSVAVAVAVTPLIASNGGLGRYTVSVNRSSLATGTYFPRVRVTLSSSRSLVVQLTVTKPTVGGGLRVGNYGPIYVLLIDPDIADPIEATTTVLAQRTSAGYVWSHTGYSGRRLSIIAGGDLDNDGFICQRGEPCGAYPVLTASNDLPVLDISSSRSGLNFQVAPLSGIVAQSVGQAGPGWRRSPVLGRP